MKKEAKSFIRIIQNLKYPESDKAELATKLLFYGVDGSLKKASSNDTETYTNDYGTIFLKNEHVIRIKNESGVLEYEKESINFNYDYQIVINESPVNIAYIGN